MPSDRNPYPGYREPRDDSYEESARGPTRRMRLLTGAVAFLALAGFTVVVWYAYTLGIRAGTESVAPLIRADGRPTKIRPEQPGGMQIPHQDKEVYDTIANGEEEPRIEVILPPQEAPLPRPTEDEPMAETDVAVSPVPTPVPPPPSSIAELLEAVEAEEDAAGAQIPVPNAPEPLLPPAPTAAATTPAEPTVISEMLPPPPPPGAAPIPIPQPAPEPLPALATVPEADPASIEEPAPAVEDLGAHWRVQIAALRSEARALAEWGRFRAAHPDLLGNLTLEVQRADLGSEKGIYYRLRVGPLADKTAAASLCVQLKVRGLGCLVVRPE